MSSIIDEQLRNASTKLERVWSDQRICLVAAVAVAASTVYGSLVPFNLRMPHDLTASAWLRQVQFTSWSEASRTDSLVNVVVGLPLGFLLMGALRARRHPIRGGIAQVLFVIGCVSALGTTIELVQVLSPVRQSSWHDVLAQDIGAGIGTVGWLLAGPSVIFWMRQLAVERQSLRFVARLLQIYLPMYIIMQLTPFDALRAADLASSHAQSASVLLASTDPFATSLFILRHLVGNVLLNVPIGALAVLGRKSIRHSLWRAVVLGLLVVAAVGIAQDAMSLRHNSALETLADVLGVVVGIMAARAFTWSRDSTDQSRVEYAWLVLASAIWMVVLVGHAWNPIAFAMTPHPLYRLYQANPLGALHAALLEYLLAVPLGLLLRMACPASRGERVDRLQSLASFGVATIVLCAMELGPLSALLSFPDITNVLIGAAGALTGIAVGAAFARRQSSADGISLGGSDRARSRKLLC